MAPVEGYDTAVCWLEARDMAPGPSKTPSSAMVDQAEAVVVIERVSPVLFLSLPWTVERVMCPLRLVWTWRVAEVMSLWYSATVALPVYRWEPVSRVSGTPYMGASSESYKKE